MTREGTYEITFTDKRGPGAIDRDATSASDLTLAAELALSIADAPTWAMLSSAERISSRKVARDINSGTVTTGTVASARYVARSMGTLDWRFTYPPGAWLVCETNARRVVNILAGPAFEVQS